MNRAGAATKFLRRFEDARAGRQLLPDLYDNSFAYGPLDRDSVCARGCYCAALTRMNLARSDLLASTPYGNPLRIEPPPTTGATAERHQRSPEPTDAEDRSILYGTVFGLLRLPQGRAWNRQKPTVIERPPSTLSGRSCQPRTSGADSPKKKSAVRSEFNGWIKSPTLPNLLIQNRMPAGRQSDL
jgi:hypothetical protein